MWKRREKVPLVAIFFKDNGTTGHNMSDIARTFMPLQFMRSIACSRGIIRYVFTLSRGRSRCPVVGIQMTLALYFNGCQVSKGQSIRPEPMGDYKPTAVRYINVL